MRKEIENKYGTKVMVLPRDLSNPKAPPEIFDRIEKENIGVDVLVNNAGFSVYGKFYETDLQKELKMTQVTVTSMLHLTKSFLRKMEENTEGWVLNVASTGAFVPVPLQSVYEASKSFVLSFTQALGRRRRRLPRNKDGKTCYYCSASGAVFHHGFSPVYAIF